MGICSCTQNKFQNIKLDNIILSELEKQKFKDDNASSFKTKNTTSPTAITQYKYNQKKKFDLKNIYSIPEKKKITMHQILKQKKLQVQQKLQNINLIKKKSLT